MIPPDPDAFREDVLSRVAALSPPVHHDDRHPPVLWGAGEPGLCGHPECEGKRALAGETR